MMVVGRKRKRYVLFASSGQTSPEERKELSRLILERHTAVDKKMVWMDQGLIVKTDAAHLIEIKGGPVLRFGEIELVARCTSGSISKLKRMATGGEG